MFWLQPQSELFGLIQILSIVFGEEPPVFSRQAGAGRGMGLGQPPARPPYPATQSQTPYPTAGKIVFIFTVEHIMAFVGKTTVFSSGSPFSKCVTFIPQSLLTQFFLMKATGLFCHNILKSVMKDLS